LKGALALWKGTTVNAKKWALKLIARPLVIGVGLALLVSVLMGLPNYSAYVDVRNALTQSIRSHLTQVAMRTAMDVPGELHQQVATTGIDGDSLYQSLLHPLNHTLAMDSLITYVYTLRLNDAQVLFVLDATPKGDADHDGQEDHSGLNEIYEDASPLALEAMHTGLPQVTQDFYTDAWGTFLSAYAPIKNQEEQVVGVVGVDLNAESYSKALAFARQKMWMQFVWIGLLSVLMGWMAYWGARSAKRLWEQTQHLADLRGKFLVVVGHEMRTPLHGMVGNAQVLEDRLGELVSQETRAISQMGHALARMVEDVLEYAQGVETRSVAYSVRLTDLSVELESLFGGRNSAQGVVFSTQIDPALPAEIMLDGSRILLVSMALLDNALEHGQPSQVRWQVKACPEGLRFDVWDNGVGLPLARRQNPFAAFEFVDGLNRQSGGMGLGLHLCARRVQAMGSELMYQPKEGGGSHFYWTIPILALEPPQNKHYNQIKVLVVDDQAMNRKVAEATLRKKGVQVTSCASGQEALEMCQHRSWDLVLMDIQMPGMDGLETAQKIRTELGQKDLCIVALTANSLEAERVSYMAAGMDGVVSKPLRLADLEPWLVVHQERPHGGARA
jgi:CheY-like chemotaxis protein